MPAENAAAPAGGTPIGQIGALCLRRLPDGALEVLLITTRETKRWSIPKGWPIDGLSPSKVAEREAFEEAGVKGRARRKRFGHYSTLKTMPDGRQVPAEVAVHVLEVRRMKRKFPERGQRKLAWMTPAEAAKMVGEPELQGLLRKAEARYGVVV